MKSVTRKQSIALTQECAYEHWHRMLFARFLAESDLLIEPESGMAISLDECRELAREKNMDWLQLASQYAVRMLPQIFRSGDPVLELSPPPETRQELEGLLKSSPPRSSQQTTVWDGYINSGRRSGRIRSTNPRRRSARTSLRL